MAVATLVTLAPARPEAGSPIGCGAVLSGDRTYTLTGDVGPCSGTGPAITVQGPAKLRLNGYTVSCEYSIELEPDPDQPDRPFPHTVTGTAGSIGIALTGTGAGLLGAGRYTTGANPTPENRVLGCDDNVVVEGDGRHSVSGVHSIQSGDAAFLILSDWNQLTGNVIRQQFLDYPGLGADPRPARCEQGGYIVEGNSNTFSKNIVSDCYDNGFKVDGCQNRLEDNSARDNAGYGFEIDGDHNVVRGNAAVKNLLGGFLVGEPVHGNTLDHNLAMQSGDDGPADGFEILGSENTLKSNTADNNGRYGIGLYGQDNVVTDNAASRSLDTDLNDATGSCGMNTWARNIFGTRSLSCIK